MKAGNLEVKLECCLCHSGIKDMKYAIRDSKKEESYFDWLYRHVKAVFTFGLGRPNPKKFLPVCESCIKTIEYNSTNQQHRLL